MLLAQTKKNGVAQEGVSHVLTLLMTYDCLNGLLCSPRSRRVLLGSRQQLSVVLSGTLCFGILASSGESLGFMICEGL